MTDVQIIKLVFGIALGAGSGAGDGISYPMVAYAGRWAGLEYVYWLCLLSGIGTM